MDKVVDEVGEKNIVQVETHNEASFKAAGHMLMEKRKHFFGLHVQHIALI